MRRRDFLAGGLGAAAAASMLVRPRRLAGSGTSGPPAPRKGGFKLKYAPHFGQFKHHAGDHFAVEYEHPNGVRVLSMCRQIPGQPPLI